MVKSCTKNLRKGKREYQYLVNVLTQQWGMNDIIVFASDHPNACATWTKFDDGRSRRIISYNPKFMNKLNEKNPYAQYAVIAHEVAHHYNGDLPKPFLKGGGSLKVNKQSHHQELAADYFAGWALKYLNVPLNQALSLFKVYEFQKSSTHPSEEKRRQSFKKGWRDSVPYKRPPKNPPVKGSFNSGMKKEDKVFLTIGGIALGGIIAAFLTK